MENFKIPNREDFLEFVNQSKLCCHCENCIEKRVTLNEKMISVYRPVYCKKHKKDLELDKWNYDKHSESSNNCNDWIIKKSILTPPEWEIKIEEEIKELFKKGIFKEITNNIKKDMINEIAKDNSSDTI